MEKIMLFLLLGVCATTTATPTTCSLTTPTTTYTTTDASVLSAIAYISNFKLSCTTPQLNLYAVEEGNTANVIPLGIVAGGEYQISIVKEVPTATKGDHTFQIYNDEGLSQLKKKLTPVSLATVVINHPGAYNGPFLSSEVMAAGFSVLVGWAAVSGRGRLLN